MGSNLALSEIFFLNKDLERERRELVERELQFGGFLQFGGLDKACLLVFGTAIKLLGFRI